MIVKGKARQNGKQLGSYLTDNDRKVNERVKVLETKGTTSQDPKKAILEMSLAAELTKGKEGLYHATINPDKSKDQGMTEAEFLKAVDTLEEELKFVGQNRVIVLHEKNGRNHIHVVWQREKDGKLLTTSHNYAAHDRARGRMEADLKHQVTKQPQNIKKDLAQVWADAKTGQEVIDKAKAKGYTIGRGYTSDRGGQRPFCVIDQDGKKHDFVRQLPGTKTAEVKARLKDIESKLPDEKTLVGQRPQKDRQNEQTRREQAPERERNFAGEREKEAATPKMEQTAKEAGQTFADIVTPSPDPAQEQQKELTRKEKFAQSLADLRAKQSQAKERSQEASDNKTTIETDSRETATQRRVRLARENLQRDDFGLEHEL